MVYDVIIIGAGAAGLFAAASFCTSAERDKFPRRLILEKTGRAGTKLLMTGAGQCNLTRSGSIKEFLTHYGEKGPMLRTALYKYNNLAVMDYFERHGLPLLCRADGKVFPKSRKAVDVQNLLLTQAEVRGFEIRCQEDVTAIAHCNGTYRISCASGNCYQSRKVIVAAGGCSYPSTGSDGTIWKVLAELGLTFIPARPALCSIPVFHYPYEALSGISIDQTQATISAAPDAPCIIMTGSLLFTHVNFSGPVILHISRYAERGSSLSLNYFPGKPREILEKELKAAAAGDHRQTPAYLSDLLPSLPRRFIETICSRAGIARNQKAAALSGSQIKTVSACLTEDAFFVSKAGSFSSAMVTAGGVALSEINLKTFEAKRFPGLYLIGELLDVDGDTGGYNLQFAFSSAHAAAEACSKN